MTDDTLTVMLADLARTETIEGWPDALPPHLSASSLGTMRCLEMWRKVYLVGEREAPGGALLWGRADQTAATVNYEQKIASHVDLPVSDVEDAFASALDEAIDECGGAGEVNWKDSSPADTLDRGVALAAAYHVQAAPRVQPVATEERFELQVPGVPVPVIGFMDVIAGYQIDVLPDVFPERVIERKTAAKMSRKITPGWRLQTMIYQAAKGLPVDIHLSVKTKTPAVYTPLEEPGLADPRDPAVDARVAAIVKSRASLLIACVETYGVEGPWPDAVSSGEFSDLCHFCGFGPVNANTCAWWR